jgi:general nucleoside transport system ATP-binding protein
MQQNTSAVVYLEKITKTFGKTIANREVDFALEKGSIHGLLGENGAGKTTLMNILFGLHKPDEGKIFVNGELQEIDNPNDAMALGVGMVHQHFMLVKTMTVTENIMLGMKSEKAPLLDTKRVREDIRSLSEKYGFKINPDDRIQDISVGSQQRVEILSAIYRGSKILILDEPTAVLTPSEVEELFTILKQLKKEGQSVILISHKLEEVLSITDVVTILRNGENAGTATIDGSVTKEDLSRLMIGRDVLFDFEKREVVPGKPRLEVKQIRAVNERGVQVLTDVSFEIREGEILGLAGVDGNGQKELCEVLTGLRQIDSGDVLVDGVQMRGTSPMNYMQKGVFHIPEDRQRSGLAMNWWIEDNLIIKKYFSDRFSGKILLNRKAIHEEALKAVEDFRVKAPHPQVAVKNLSGGNQQKVILARELGDKPKVLIANQPTRGLDVGAMEYVRQKILDQKTKGTAILLVSADLEEIYQLSDRIAVIYNGSLMGTVENDADVQEVGLMMAGIRSKREI